GGGDRGGHRRARADPHAPEPRRQSLLSRPAAAVPPAARSERGGAPGLGAARLSPPRGRHPGTPPPRTPGPAHVAGPPRKGLLVKRFVLASVTAALLVAI